MLEQLQQETKEGVECKAEAGGFIHSVCKVDTAINTRSKNVPHSWQAKPREHHGPENSLFQAEDPPQCCSSHTPHPYFLSDIGESTTASICGIAKFVSNCPKKHA
jgi:hypothetical protein